MKCMMCGMENQNGATICLSCGSVLNQSVPGQTQPVQQNMQGMQNMGGYQTQYGQTQYNQTQYNQPNMQGMPNMGVYQPQYGQTQYGQTQYGQTQYTQPQFIQQQPPKLKKPLSKGAKIGIISAIVVALLTAVFFIFIFPILTRSELKGEYAFKAKASNYTKYYLFNDGVYLNYCIYDGETTKEYDEIGYYTKSGDKVILTDISGSTSELTFDKKKNTILAFSATYKSSDKNAKPEVSVSKNYLETIKDRIETAASTALANEEVYEEAMWWGSYYVYGNDLKDPYTEFEKELSLILDYNNDEVLKFLLENDIFGFDVDISSNGKVTVTIY